MQIVIDIPQGLKIDFENENWTALSCMEMKDALMEGTPLPKGHGRIIDADDMWDSYHSNDYDFYEALDDTPTIIEADSESEDKE